MGLDIYLYRYNHYQETIKLEEEYSRKSEKIWDKESAGKKYEELTDEEKDRIRELTKKLASDMGLDEWGEDFQNKTKLEFDDLRYPKHNFKIGYFRSSYNDSGTNRILKRTIGKDLYHIFDTNGEDHNAEYTDWVAAKTRCQEVLSEFKAWVAKNGKYDVMRVDARLFNDDRPEDDKQAFDQFLDEISKWKEDRGFESYENGRGTFFKKGLKCYGFIPGTKTIFGKEPAMYVLIKGSYKYYVHALEIVMATIDYVLAQPDPEKFFLSWSG